MTVRFPEKLEPLKDHYEYKAVYGGRAGMKTRTFAGQLILDASERYEFTLCCRETWKSIEHSSKSILERQIKTYNLNDYYIITKNEILNRVNGSKFIFMGMSRHLDAIKSIEGLTRCWVEEAQFMTATSFPSTTFFSIAE